MSDKFQLQASQYKFPYHYVPQSSLQSYEDLVVSARVDWGLEYLMTLDKVTHYLNMVGADEVLDVGCGDGRLVDRLRSTGADIKYLGIDLVEEAICLARSLNCSENFERMDLKDLDDTFSFIVCTEVLEHIADYEIPVFLENIFAHLKPKGRFIITVPSDARLVHKKHFRHYSKEMLQKQLKDAGFAVLECEEFYNESFLAKFITRLLSNSIFTINHRGFKKFLLKRLTQQVLNSNSRGTHIFAVVEAK